MDHGSMGQQVSDEQGILSQAFRISYASIQHCTFLSDGKIPKIKIKVKDCNSNENEKRSFLEKERQKRDLIYIRLKCLSSVYDGA